MAKGIQETKDLVIVAISLGNALGKAMADKKFNLADVGAFIDPMLNLPAALAGISEVPSEIEDMDEAERIELFETVKEKFDLPDDKVEAAIEEGLILATSIYNYVDRVFLS